MKPDRGEIYYSEAGSCCVLPKTSTTSYCNYLSVDLQQSQRQNADKKNCGMKEGLYCLLISE